MVGSNSTEGNILDILDSIKGHTFFRMAVGGVTSVAVRAVVKPLSYYAAAKFMGKDPAVLKVCFSSILHSHMHKVQIHPKVQFQTQRQSIENKEKLYAEITCKFLTYMAIGINVICVAPILFRFMRIERSTYYTEV